MNSDSGKTTVSSRVLKSLGALLGRPMSARGLDLFAAIGLLAFGLSGFIDRMDGLGFPSYKIIALAAGALWVAVWTLKRSR